MTNIEYAELTDRYRAIGALLDASLKMTGTETWEGLTAAAQYLALARESMDELATDIERLLAKE